MSLYWIPAVLASLTTASAGFFFALYLGSAEPVPLRRAKLLWRWTVVIVLGTFDLWIFARVLEMLRFIFFG